MRIRASRHTYALPIFESQQSLCQYAVCIQHQGKKYRMKQQNIFAAVPSKPISICHGQNCRDVGGRALAQRLDDLGITYTIIPCQSLCSYAPTAKLGEIAMLHADIDEILEHAHA